MCVVLASCTQPPRAPREAEGAGRGPGLPSPPGCPAALYTRLDLGPSLSPSRGLSRRAGLCLLVTPTGHGTYRGPAEGGVALQPCAGAPTGRRGPHRAPGTLADISLPTGWLCEQGGEQAAPHSALFRRDACRPPRPPLPCAPAKREAWVIGPLVRSQRCSPRLGLPRRRVPAVKCPSSSPRSRAR